MKKKIFILSIVFFLTDLISKLLITSSQVINKIIIKNFFSLVKTYNTGAAFSILTGYRFLFIILGFFVIFIIYRYFIDNKKLNNIETVAYSLLIGGIVGNLFDRICYGYVIDFLSFKVFNYYFPVFNFADMFIVVGTIIIIIYMIWSEKNENRSK